jgi:hypothetical protein
MPIDFPTSPTVGQQYDYAGISYVYTAQGQWLVYSPPLAEVSSGSLMLFGQSSAPLGWTKQTAHHDKTLRIVSGAAAASGAVPFSTVFAKTATDLFTLTVNEMPSHTNSLKSYAYGTPPGPYNIQSGGFAGQYGGILASGGNAPHGHGIDMRVATVDAIIASKN